MIKTDLLAHGALEHRAAARPTVILGLDSFPEKPNEHAGYVSVLYSRLRIGSAQRFPEARRLTA